MTPAHAAEVTELLREEEPPLGLALNEAVCPSCHLAYLVTHRAFDWGVCRDCLDEALIPVPDGLSPPGGTPPLF